MAKRKIQAAQKKTSTEKEASVYYIREHDQDPLFAPHFAATPAGKGELPEKGRASYSALKESICGGVDDSQPVEKYDGSLGVPTSFVAAHQGPVCQVQWNSNLAAIYNNPGDVSGVRWGTGTMISDDLMLTCGHLFDQAGGGWQRPRVNGTTNIIPPQEIARNMHVNFNFQEDPNGTLRQEQSFAITELIEYRLGDIDMAICRIAGNPGAIFGRTEISSKDAAVPDMICIIGHPAGAPKVIEAGPTSGITGNFITYGDIDTQGGNSGSGILKVSTGQLVGIHTDGGCRPTSPADGKTNHGQRIEAVIAVSPTLKRLTRYFFIDLIKALTDPIREKAIVTDPIVDVTRKEILKDPIKNGFKEVVNDPNTFVESLTSGVDPRLSSVIPSNIGVGGVTPFVMSSPSRVNEASGANQNDVWGQLSAIQQALEEFDRQRTELAQAYIALAQSAGLM